MNKQFILSLAIFHIAMMLIIGPALAIEYPLTIKDSAGRSITFEQPVSRIIVLNSDAAEAVSVLGAANRIVGVSDTLLKKGYYFPELAKKQSVGKWNQPDWEMIGEIARNGENEITPDIVVISYSYPDKPYGIFSVEKNLAPFKNIKSVALDFFKPENMTKELETLGKILDTEEAAQSYIDWYNKKKSNVLEAVSGLSKPKVYVEWSSTQDISTLGAGSGFDQVLNVANGYNIARKLTDTYPKVSWEWVITQNPDIIIKRQTQSSDQKQIGWENSPSEDAVKLQATRNDLLDRSGSTSINAVKSDKVFVMDWDVLNGLDQIVGITYIAKLLHPEIDLDPKEVHAEYLKIIGLDMPEGRTFVFPEIS